MYPYLATAPTDGRPKFGEVEHSMSRTATRLDVNTGYFHPDRVYLELETLPGIPSHICGTCAVDALYDVYYWYPDGAPGTTTGCEHCRRLGLDVAIGPWAPTFTAPSSDDCGEWDAPTSDPSEDCGEFSIEAIRAHLAELAPSSPAPTAPEVAEVVKAGELAPVEWLNTRRGIVGISEVRTRRPSGSDLVTWVWFTEAGDSGMVDGEAGRAMAITDAYVSMVRAGEVAPEVYPWER